MTNDLVKVKGSMTPEQAFKTAAKAFKTLGLLDYMSPIKAPSAAWVMINGIKKITIISNFDIKKMQGAIKIQAEGVNGTTSVMSISDQAKIAKIKAEVLKKSLKASGLI